MSQNCYFWANYIPFGMGPECLGIEILHMRLSVHTYSGKTEQDCVYPSAFLKYLQFLKLLNSSRLIFMFCVKWHNTFFSLYFHLFFSFNCMKILQVQLHSIIIFSNELEQVIGLLRYDGLSEI